MLGTVKEHIKQGFQWGAREGPLCDERGVIFSSHLTLFTTISFCSDAQRQIPHA